MQGIARLDILNSFQLSLTSSDFIDTTISSKLISLPAYEINDFHHKSEVGLHI